MTVEKEVREQRPSWSMIVPGPQVTLTMNLLLLDKVPQ